MTNNFTLYLSANDSISLYIHGPRCVEFAAALDIHCVSKREHHICACNNSVKSEPIFKILASMKSEGNFLNKD